MNKTSLRLFFSLSFLAAVIAVLLLLMNVFCVAIIGSDTYTNSHQNPPEETTGKIASALVQTGHGFVLADESLVGDGCWCILVDGRGNVVWSQNMPSDIPTHYTINDIARITRWFLNDYPVYVHTTDFGLLIYGIPKNAVGKYQMVYTKSWYHTLPLRLALLLMLNIALALLLALIFGRGLYRGIQCLTSGLKDLRDEKDVSIPERGMFREVSRNINQASRIIARKNRTLARQDSARANWVSGISHDIRTPLSIIMGYSEEITDEPALPEHIREKAGSINLQSVKIKKLIEDLNLISSLAYDMQPSQKKEVRICPLLRRIAADAMNNPLAHSCELEMEFSDERATVFADGQLLGRAIFNLMNNSITHNKSGCRILVETSAEPGAVCISISDNGAGVPAEVLSHLEEMPKSVHGIGLPMAYRIVCAHGGSLRARNEHGFIVEIRLPAGSYS